MAARKSAVTKAMQDARDLDLRRQAQIANQIEIINRLTQGETVEEIGTVFQERLAATEVMLADARAENARLQAEQSGA